MKNTISVSVIVDGKVTSYHSFGALWQVEMFVRLLNLVARIMKRLGMIG